MTKHLELELIAAAHRGRPLDPGEPVPGCDCVACTSCVPECPVCYGVRRPKQLRQRRHPDRREPINVDHARAAPIWLVAQMLGIEPNRYGWAVCPFHDDSAPSFHLNAKKNAAFCNPCGKSWDPIALVMDMRKCTFVDAVKELAA